MTIPFFWVDAFAERIFQGNPAAVCPLERWLEDAEMLAMAAENGLSETAFFVPTAGRTDGYHIRWFTPVHEVDLCGHATLASAHVVFTRLVSAERASAPHDRLTFVSKSGELLVTRDGARITLDFPATPPSPTEAPRALIEAIGGEPTEVLGARDWILVYSSEAEIRALAPDMAKLARLGDRAVIVTAKGDEVDFVSRFFAPAAGIPEDPVTGSAHCALIPLWSRRLGKKELIAAQRSKRGGLLHCRYDSNDRVAIAGQAVLYLEGHVHVDA